MRKLGRRLYEFGNPPDPIEDLPPIRWWHVVVGGPLVALSGVALIYGFGILSVVLEGGH